MTRTPGTHTLTPEDADLLLHTTCEGAMAAMGHNLTLVVGRWEATVTVAEAVEGCRVEVTADLGSLTVREGRGGAKPLTTDDRAKIERNALRAFGNGTELRFVADTVAGTWEAGTVSGQLTINRQTHPQSFDVTATEAGYRLTGTVTQTRFGLKPFSTMLGALKLGDDIAVEITAPL